MRWEGVEARRGGEEEGTSLLEQAHWSILTQRADVLLALRPPNQLFRKGCSELEVGGVNHLPSSTVRFARPGVEETVNCLLLKTENVRGCPPLATTDREWKGLSTVQRHHSQRPAPTHLLHDDSSGDAYASSASDMNTANASVMRTGCQLKSWLVSLVPAAAAGQRRDN
eukprot:365126-Chlamydomonas_euryale.AAC.19